MRTKTVVKTYHYFDEEETKKIKQQIKDLDLTIKYIAFKMGKAQTYVYQLIAGNQAVKDKDILVLEKLGIKTGMKI